MARTVRELYSEAVPDVILCLLVHKIIRATLDEGITEGRLLLQDWLTVFTSKYTQHIQQEDPKKPVSRIVDTTFSKYSNLRNLPRLAFGLLKSPLLWEKQADSDYWSYLHCLYRCCSRIEISNLNSALEPRFLHRVVYPVLTSFGAANNMASQNLSLSRSSVTTCGCRLFLLDAYTMLIIYYMEPIDGTSEPIPFPPAKDSMVITILWWPQLGLIRTLLNKLKQDRGITPKVLMIKSGDTNELFFDLCLVEEQNQAGLSYLQFLEIVQAEVGKFQTY